jgi:Protein of unknown function (DUF3040)
MALSMDEQRVLAEIERRLAEEEPRLAACMTSFRRPGPAVALRSPRARILCSLFTVMVVAIISLMVYAVIPFRGTHGVRTPGGSAPGQTAFTAATGSTPGKATISAVPNSGARSVTGTHTTAAGVTGMSVHAKNTPAVKGTKAKSGQG